MISYWLVFIGATVSAMISQAYRKRSFLISGWFACCTFAILVLFAGLRKSLGDTIGYWSYFVNDIDASSLTASFSNTHHERGFVFYEWVVKNIGDNPQFFVFITSVIVLSVIVRFTYKYSSSFWFAIYLFIASSNYQYTMSAIRQYFAAAILIACYGWLAKGHRWKYFLAILLAASVHESAIIVIPVLFITRMPVWHKMTAVVYTSIIFLILFYSQYSSGVVLLANAAGMEKYAGHLADSSHTANIIRPFILLAPCVMAYINRQKMQKESNLFIHLSIMNFIVMLLATNNWIFARMSMYFGIYTVMLWPEVIRSYRKEIQPYLIAAVAIVYLILFYLDSAIRVPITYQSDYIRW